MKKILAFVLCVLLILCIACQDMASNKKTMKIIKKSSGIWLTYYEISDMLNSENGLEYETQVFTESCLNLGITDVYLHIRANCDSIFKSAYFPLTKEAEKYEYDVFQYFIDALHKKELRVHAWINPYRVSAVSTDVDSLPENSPVYLWLNDNNKENDKNVCFSKGLYLNPSEPQVQKLIIDGVKEVISKYNVDGIHFDDYFYPTTDSEFDNVSFETYLKTTENPISLVQWRRANVNTLIGGCYNAIKSINPNVIFSISPAASIENNFNDLYADVEYWVENNIIDLVIPQLYFGFEYPDDDFKFQNLLNEWLEIIKINKNVKLQIGLGIYKADTENLIDKTEWSNNQDIIARQVEICLKDNQVSGYVFFSSSSLFSKNEPFVTQRENLFKVLKKYTTTEV